MHISIANFPIRRLRILGESFVHPDRFILLKFKGIYAVKVTEEENALIVD